MTDENFVGKPNSSGKVQIWIVIIVLLIVLGIGDWYFFLRKSAEGGKCATSTN